MSLLTSLLIGHSGLRAAQAGVNATSHNVANASTEGATRRTVLTSVSNPLRRGPIWIGQGVQTDGILRQSDRLLTARRIQGAGEATRATYAWENLRSLERVMDVSEGQTSKGALEEFWDSLTRATADPADLSLRRGIVRAGSELGSFLARDARAFADTMSDQVANASGFLPTVNATLQRVAELNEGIAASGAGGLVAGDLVDQRDQLLRELGENIGITVEIDAEEMATVFIDSHAAVSGGAARTLSLEETASGPRVLLSHSKSTGVDVTDGLGGRLGGHLDVYEQVADWHARLETFVVDLATALNTQHAAGFDLNGDPGGDLFVYDPADPAGSLTLHPDIVDDAALLAFGGVTPTTAGDIDNLRLLMDLENAVIIDGTRNASDWLTDLVAEVGTDVATLELTALTQDALVRDLDELHQNLHGIDLDEEAANLLVYQTAYQASARIVTVSSQLMDTLLEIAR